MNHIILATSYNVLHYRSGCQSIIQNHTIIYIGTYIELKLTKSDCISIFHGCMYQEKQNKTLTVRLELISNF